MLGSRTMHRRSHAPGAWADGSYTPGAMTASTFAGTWRPMPGRQVELLAQGDRERDPRVLYTTTRLLISSQHDNQPPDRVSPDGAVWYELTSEYDGHEALGQFTAGVRHYKYTAMRLQEGLS